MADIFQEINDRPMRLCKKCNNCHGNFPTSFWDELPDGCGFSGWFFAKREEIKQKIRKQKELLLEYETIFRENSQLVNYELVEKINKLKKEISVYHEYGSEDW